jgi:hypothetical protein
MPAPNEPNPAAMATRDQGMNLPLTRLIPASRQRLAGVLTAAAQGISELALLAIVPAGNMAWRRSLPR